MHRFFLVALSAVLLPACRGAGFDDLVGGVQTHGPAVLGDWRTAPKNTVCAAPEGDAHVVYRAGKHVYRLEARAGAQPEDVSKALDRLGPGTDHYINTSPNGEWLLVQTTRFGCPKDMECLTVVSKNLCAAQTVLTGGLPPTVDGEGAAIADDGSFIVFPASGGPHVRDLWIARREGAYFGKAALLTKDSEALFNQQPALSNDGTRVLFDCGGQPGPERGTSICEVKTDGTDLRVVVAANQGPIDGEPAALHHADYMPDGTIAFEGSWNRGAEQIWHLPPIEPEGDTTPQSNDNERRRRPALVSNQQRLTDDNSPCVLPDGRIVSLWMGRAKAHGHELKIMNPDGTGIEMLLENIDVADIGIGCSR